MQLILLLCGDIDTCPGPTNKRGTCLKSIRKNQSKFIPSPHMLECNVCNVVNYSCPKSIPSATNILHMHI